MQSCVLVNHAHGAFKISTIHRNSCWSSRCKPAKVHVCAITDQTVSFADFTQYVVETQQSIIEAAEKLEGSGRVFQRDRWERDPSDPNAG